MPDPFLFRYSGIRLLYGRGTPLNRGCGKRGTGYRVAAAVELLKSSIAITIPVAVSTTALTATTATMIISVSSPRFCDTVLALASEKMCNVVVDAGDITVTGALDEAGEVAENSGDTLSVVVDALEAVTTTDMEAVVVSVAETEKYNRH